MRGYSAKKPVQEISLFYHNEEPSLINLISSHSVSYELHTFQFYTSLNYTEEKKLKLKKLVNFKAPKLNGEYNSN